VIDILLITVVGLAVMIAIPAVLASVLGPLFPKEPKDWPQNTSVQAMARYATKTTYHESEPPEPHYSDWMGS